MKKNGKAEDNVPSLSVVDRRMPKNIFAIPLWSFLRFYKICVSPVLHLLPGTGCRFYPTCSDYAITAISKHGAFKGVLLSICRLLRCQPFCEGGFDYVPERFAWRRLFRRNPVEPINNVDERHKSDN